MKIKHHQFFLALFLLCVIENAEAQTVDDTIRQDIQIQQRIKQEKQDLERKRDLQEINRAKEKSRDTDTQSKDKDFIDDGKCRKIDKIIVSGNKELSLKKFTKKEEGKCLTKTDLQNIRQLIQNYYIEKGYVLARVYFDKKNISQAIIEIVVEEGKVSNLEIKDNSKINDAMPLRRSLQRFFAFGFTKDQTVNLRDIEQGLDQINRLSSNNAKMDMTPSELKDGYSDIVINNQVKNISKPSIAINNSGNENTGKVRETITLDQDNLIGVNDNIYLSHSRSDYDGVNKKYFKSDYVAASIPFAYYTLGTSYSYSNYLTTARTSLSSSVSSGNTRSSSYYVSKVLARDKKYKISLKADLANIKNSNYLNDVFLDVSSRELTVGKLSLDNIFYTNFGTIFLQPKYNKGVDWVGAKKDSKNLNQDAARAQFNLYGLYGSFSNNFSIPKTNVSLFHNLSFDSQYSEDRLFSSEQISIGGRYTIRGFEESSIGGDNGYYIKNDLTVNTFQLASEFMQKSLAGSTLQKINIGTFYDYGYVRNKIINDDADEGYMSGAGVKLSYNGEYLKADLTYSKGLHSPQFVKNIFGITKDNESIYFDVKFGLF
jgi:hemolysin activation/secretion protein